MAELPPTLRGIDPTRHAKRRAALLDLAKEQPVAVFGMGSATGAGTRSHGGMRFLTGWDSHESNALLLLSQHETRLLLTSPFMLPSALETVPDLSPQYLPAAQLPQTVAAFMDGQTPALIGVDEMPMGMYRLLAPYWDNGSDFTSRLDDLRQVKAPAALELHRYGAAICDRIFAALPEVIQYGRRARDSQRILENLAREQGADSCRTWLTIGPQADYPRYWPEETQRPAQAGDQMLFGVALTVDGHWAHGLRMGHIGAVPPAISRLHAGVANAMDLGRAALRPGRSISDAVKAMASCLDAASDGAKNSSFRTGHGLGLTYEEPGLTAAFPQSFGAAPEPHPLDDGPILKAGMILELHPNLFINGIGGAALGQMIEVTQTGAKPLLKSPLELITLV
ncbi:M24 family metallopeptidase [Sulfitobacter sp.]|uniref:M24 family metallopeptidase n=1 Tax=Sulfitobacter sp. TaxID=1903071 RepID=UPI003297BF51